MRSGDSSTTPVTVADQDFPLLARTVMVRPTKGFGTGTCVEAPPGAIGETALEL